MGSLEGGTKGCVADLDGARQNHPGAGRAAG